MASKSPMKIGLTPGVAKSKSMEFEQELLQLDFESAGLKPMPEFAVENLFKEYEPNLYVILSVQTQHRMIAFPNELIQFMVQALNSCRDEPRIQMHERLLPALYPRQWQARMSFSYGQHLSSNSLFTSDLHISA